MYRRSVASARRIIEEPIHRQVVEAGEAVKLDGVDASLAGLTFRDEGLRFPKFLSGLKLGHTGSEPELPSTGAGVAAGDRPPGSSGHDPARHPQVRQSVPGDLVGVVPSEQRSPWPVDSPREVLQHGQWVGW